MVTAQQIKQKIEEAKANPNSIVATELRKRLDSGAYDSQLSEIGLSRTPQGLKPVQQDSFRQDLRETGQNIKGTIQERLGNIDTIRGAMQSGEQGGVRSVLQTAGQVAGGISDIAGQALIGAGKAVLPQKAEEAIGGAVQTGVQAITQNPAFETSAVGTLMSKYNTLKETNPKVARDIDALLGISALGLDVATAGVGSNVTKKGVSTLKKGIQETGEGVTNILGDGAKLNIPLPKSDEIMNRVARLTPKQATEFEKLAGKTHGEYLRETGNFGTPDEIIKNEATKFTQSIKSVDDTLATLPGTYKDGSITDAINGLKEKAIATSSENVKSPMLAKVTEFETKLNNEGLTMSEINDLKRLYEREVRLGYNRTLNPDKVQLATNIDNELRNWQVKQAEDLGFENIAELNKQTQLSKYIINKLGDQVVGKTGLNNLGLTDWIMLSGGDPTAVGGFLAKKFFSSKSVQSKIAQMLNKGEVKGLITPKVTPSKQLPQQSLKIESKKALPKSSTNSTKASSSLSTPSLKVKGEIPETSQTTVYHGGNLKGSVKSGLYVSDLETASKYAKSNNGTVNELVLNKKLKLLPTKDFDSMYADFGYDTQKASEYWASKGYDAMKIPNGDMLILNPKAVKISSPETNLISEAKKYKSAEEFVKAQFSKKPEYGMGHRPSFDGMPPAYNLLEGDVLPRDVYTHPDFSIASGAIRRGEKAANESWTALQKIKDNPNAEITIYRAGAKNELNTGDWVTFSKEYAKQSVEGTEKVHSFKVKAKDILFAGDDINEFGYYPKSQLEEIWKKANQVTPESSLINEAKKYKSADEFVKAQGETMYRGVGGKSEYSKNKLLGEGKYIIDRKDIAERFGNVEEYIMPKNIKLFKEKFTTKQEFDNFISAVSKYDKEFADVLKKEAGSGVGISYDNIISHTSLAKQTERLQSVTTKALQDIGYDGIQSGHGNIAGAFEDFSRYGIKNKVSEKFKNTVLFTSGEQKLLTKSQLEEIWKKANQQKSAK